MKLKMTIERYEFSLLQLISQVDRALNHFLTARIERGSGNLSGESNSVLHLEKPWHILLLTGSLIHYTAPSTSYNARSILPCTIYLSQDSGHGVQISKHALVHFPRIGDVFEAGIHSYFETTKVIQYFQATKHVRAEELAHYLLKRMEGDPYPPHWGKDFEHYFDSLLVLMFGVEVSRNNFTLLSNLMLLDLIAAQSVYGKNKIFNFENAFLSRRQFRTCNKNQSFFAGKYPMSVKDSGMGNTGKGIKESKLRELEINIPLYKFRHMRLGRGGLLEIAEHNLEQAHEELKRYPHRHGILKREAALLYHWLNHACRAGYTDYETVLIPDIMPRDTDEEILEFVVNKLIIGRLKILTQENEPLKPGQTFLSAQQNHIAYLIRCKQEEKQQRPQQPRESFPLDKLTRTQELDRNGKPIGKPEYGCFFHRRRTCKLIPGYVKESHYALHREGGRLSPYKTELVTAENLGLIKSEKMNPCPNCYP